MISIDKKGCLHRGVFARVFLYERIVTFELQPSLVLATLVTLKDRVYVSRISCQLISHVTFDSLPIIAWNLDVREQTCHDYPNFSKCHCSVETCQCFGFPAVSWQGVYSRPIWYVY